MIKKAVIPAAGLGTRFLPATKSMPKEMLPIVDTPAIHFVVKEAIESGIDDIIIITGRGKRAIEDYFDESPELEMHLERNGKKKKLQMIREISQMADIHYIRQKEPKGLPDAILKAEKHIRDEPFAVLLGDDVIRGKIPCTGQLLDVFEKYKSSILAVKKVDIKEISKYGSVKGRLTEDRIYLVEDIVEKPKLEEAPSNIASIGRYIFTPKIFDCIRETLPSINKELQIADSINILRKMENVYALEIEGKRYDIGNKLGYIQAVIDFSVGDEKIGKDVSDYMRRLCKC